MYFRRLLERKLSATVSRNKVRLLFGARQTGKTSLLTSSLPAASTRVINLASPAVRRHYEVDPGALARELRALPPAIENIVIDEIQKVPALLDEVQALYDADQTRFQIFLTGSSARRLRQGSANLLPGRCHVYRLTPVSLWESEDHQPRVELGPRPDIGHESFPARSLEARLLFGCLPGPSLEPPETSAATLASYVEVYLEEEIRREALARDLGAFASFVRLAALQSGRPVNLARLSQESGVAASTLKSFYQVLVDTHLGYWVEPFGYGSKHRVLKTPRFLFFDVGIRNAAAGLPLAPGLLGVEGAILLEHWVGLELLYRADYLGRGHRVSYWRTRSGAEVDFVWESPDEDVPIEVKWTERPTVSDARHLELFLERFPDRARRGVLVCRVPEPQQLTARVTAVGWNRF